MSVLILDFEATGVDANTVRTLEIGAQVTPNDFSEPLISMSQLVWGSGYPALTNEVQEVTGITQRLLDDAAVPPEDAFKLLSDIIPDDLEFCVAFNRSYDEALFKAEAKRLALGIMRGGNILLQVPWLCAMVDVEENYKFKSWKLKHLALDHGVTVNPKELHRAINDVELTRKMLHSVPTCAEKMYEFQKEPWVYLQAQVSFANKDLAKAQGFTWERAKGDDSDRVFTKTWVKRVKSSHVEREMDHGFKVITI